MLLVFEIFSTNFFLATHSETDCISLSVAVISLAVVPDLYSVESSEYIDTQALLIASGRSLVNIGEKVRGLDSCPALFYLDSIKEHFLEDRTLYPQYSWGCKAITCTFFQQLTIIDHV